MAELFDAPSVPIDWNHAPPFGRRPTLNHTLEILLERSRHLPSILEIGTSYTYSPDGIGNAILAFAWYVSRFGGNVTTVDVRTSSTDSARQVLRDYAPACADIPNIVGGDCFDYAETRHSPIDLLYMDAGFELACDSDYASFARRFADRIPSFYVELYNRFDPACFRPGALMLFDDTQPVEPYWGKGYFLIPKLIAEGSWRQVNVRGVPVFPMVLLERV